MKRFITVLSGLLILPAFAEVAPVYYDEIVEYTDDMIDAVEAEEDAVAQPAEKSAVVQRSNITRSTSRAVSSAKTGTAQRSGASTRAVASSRATTSRAAATRAVKAAGVKSRPSATRSTNVVSRSPRNSVTQRPVTARASVRGSVMGVAKNAALDDGSVNTVDSSPETYRAATTRRASTARFSTGSAVSTGVATTPVITEEEVSSTTSNLNAIAELTDYCKAQYAACMDNYCNVLDDNQGRCSCSKNLKNYELTEQALEDATEKFQEAVQKIKYIGLTANQIESLFDETEAEKMMDEKGEDKTSIRKTLNEIKERVLVDAQSGKASSTFDSSSVSMNTSGLFDINLDSGFDLSSFMGSYNTNNTSSVSNQRGEQLYKTATSRCKTAVLNSCVAQGIDANVITNSYDLEIDKQCIAYERSLNDANTEMRKNARNAAVILQQARLVLAQNKNTYDVRNCVAAIDACMQDDYVCGTDYELCLDPTGKYIANGEIVKGGTPGVSGGVVRNADDLSSSDQTNWTSEGMQNLYSVWNYTINDGPVTSTSSQDDTLNPWGRGKSENLSSYINSVMEKYWKSNYEKQDTSDDMAVYILRKIGYIDSKDSNKVHGMCASIMKQCQDYTYTTKNKVATYNPTNEVLYQYLASALTKIKLKQDVVLATYAEDCRSDVESCLSTNNYEESNPNSSTSTTAINACRADIVTCMSVGGFTPKDNTQLTLSAMRDWVKTISISCAVGEWLHETPGTTTTALTLKCETCNTVTYKTGSTPEGSRALTSTGGRTTKCVCESGYSATGYDGNGHPTGCVKAAN